FSFLVVLLLVALGVLRRALVLLLVAFLFLGLLLFGFFLLGLLLALDPVRHHGAGLVEAQLGVGLAGLGVVLDLPLVLDDVDQTLDDVAVGLARLAGRVDQVPAAGPGPPQLERVRAVVDGDPVDF